MIRIETMARFAEPEDEKPIKVCKICGEDLYEGDEVFTLGDGYHYCSLSCTHADVGVFHTILER